MNLTKVYAIVFGILVSAFIYTRLGTVITGPWLYLVYGWFISLFAALLLSFKSIGKWLGLFLILAVTTSCNYIPSDQIGVWVKNFGRTPNDYSIVMGKFPKDYTRSTWAITFSGKPFSVEVEPIKVNSKDGIQFTVDPSALSQLIRSNEACRKYAFKLSAYKDDIDSGLQDMLRKEILDVVRKSINSATGDSVMFNQTHFSDLAQEGLDEVMQDKYGIELLQFSMSIQPPANLQNAINDRLLAEQQAKQTLASLQNEEAKVKLEKIKAQRAEIQQATLTPAMLRNKELDVTLEIYRMLAKSPNKVIIVGDPNQVILKQ